MTEWEYKCVPLDRRGTKGDFSFNWTYGPWELMVDRGGKKPLSEGLDELGRQGWELAAVLPSDLWSEGARTPNASHGVRTISCTLVFKKPADEKTKGSPTKTASATTPAAPATSAAPATPATSSPSGSTPAPSTPGPVTAVQPAEVPPAELPPAEVPPAAAPTTAPPPPKAPSDDSA